MQVKFVLLNSYAQEEEEERAGILARLVQLGTELVSLLTLLDSGDTLGYFLCLYLYIYCVNTNVEYSTV